MRTMMKSALTLGRSLAASKVEFSSFRHLAAYSPALGVERLSRKHHFPFCSMTTKTAKMNTIPTLAPTSTMADNDTRSPSTLAMAAAALMVTTTFMFTKLDGMGHPSASRHLASAEEIHTTGVIKNDSDESSEEVTTLLNWSGTHSITFPASQFYEPESIEELEQIIHQCYVTNTPIRPIGSALSPNGIAFHYKSDRKDHRDEKTGAMISLVHLDKILDVDKENLTVTVQAGARVSQVIEALRPHGLTLPNLASIAEQQIGGFIQVGAHGTGARIPPVDEFCTSLKLVTTHMGTLMLSAQSGIAGINRTERDHLTPTNPLFDMAKVGLGSLGVVTEVTLKCIPAHNLVEHTYVLTRKEAYEQINTLLSNHKHVRYMWIPYEDAVVVVTNDPEDDVMRYDPATSRKANAAASAEPSRKGAMAKRMHQFEPLTNLLIEICGERFTEGQVLEMGFGELRDQLLAIDPLNLDHVKRCNRAEAEFWRRSEGFQVKPSDQLLQFDCGGQQWVWEVCFPTGSYLVNDGNDMQFMKDLLAGIEQHGITAHSPIEQRWTASSSSLLSPAYGPPEGLHCWVGIIMYLPTDDVRQRLDITHAFKDEYCELMKHVGEKFGAASHWAKLEMPNSPEAVQELQRHIQSRYPVQYFNFARYTLDPTNLLSNDLVNVAFGEHTSKLFESEKTTKTAQ